ncbi:NUDIX hydrolase [Aureibacter tunicatorum]|uniref:8-oxo-dGTP diphosphatase n=1 Tax=Aureibacter tunicatorum TaxID=866807 RepID=A0AAE4BRA6_9BACT|nr:NUDIX domain-containing protein [Aureibacter tunicatorum]MDR6240009.1 8-oxo-dGTP diphosphatase [Aureibacter tunicatorum]BDD04481.1 7,8-dihydro-8-oxoguanine triphosphatase [Aureibacter tunicatorum]
MKIPLGLKRTATLCVLKNGDRFLLLKRFKEPNKDNFTPVGGKLDPFESPKNAAIREVFEETGIKVASMKYCGILTESSPTKYNWTNYVYLAEIDYVEPPICNEGILEWISFENVLNIVTPKTDWHIYDYLLRGKTFAFHAEYSETLELLTMVEEIEDKLIY